MFTVNFVNCFIEESKGNVIEIYCKQSNFSKSLRVACVISLVILTALTGLGRVLSNLARLL